MDSVQTQQYIIDSLTAAQLLDSPMSLKEMVIDSVLHNEFLQGGAILGAIMGILVYLKEIPMALWSRFKRAIKYTVYFDSNDSMYEVFTEWFNENHPTKFKNIMVDIKQGSKSLERNKRFTLKINQNVDWNWFWYKGNIIVAEKSKQILENASSPLDRYLDSYTLYSFFSRKQMISLLEELRVRKVNSSDDENQIFYNGTYGWQELEVKNIKSFENVFIEGKEDLIKDLDTFKSNQEHYNKLGISAKRGYLFHGAPGNGKTSIAMAMSKYLNRDLYLLNLASISSDRTLTDLVANINKDSIIVFEDIDSFNKDRFGEKDKSHVSFSTLLNTLNGALEPDNCIIIMTTNHLESLDPALVRPGRIDRIIHLDNPKWQVIYQFLRAFYKDVSDMEEFNHNQTFNVSMSQIQDWCLQNPEEKGYVKVIEELMKNVKNEKK